jgi:DNA replication and repair protein RecF
VLAVGLNGVGKTNLLESLHVGTQGFSPRTRSDVQLIRFGDRAARINVRGTRGTVPVEIELTLEAGAGKRAKLNGGVLRAAEHLRAETATLVFTPDRLGVVKGAPAVRRAYFDRALGRLTPARAQLSTDYGAAVAQRNASLRRVAGGFSTREALAPWTEQVAALGTELVSARHEALALLQPAFAERAGELGLAEAVLRYEGEPLLAAALEARLDRDLDRGVTGLGPHLDDIVLAAGGRRGGADHRAPWFPAAPPPRRRALGARSRAAAHPGGPCGRRGPGLDHGNGCGDAARRARPVAARDPWGGVR